MDDFLTEHITPWKMFIRGPYHPSLDDEEILDEVSSLCDKVVTASIFLLLSPFLVLVVLAKAPTEHIIGTTLTTLMLSILMYGALLLQLIATLFLIRMRGWKYVLFPVSQIVIIVFAVIVSYGINMGA